MEKKEVRKLPDLRIKNKKKGNSILIPFIVFGIFLLVLWIVSPSKEKEGEENEDESRPQIAMFYYQEDFSVNETMQFTTDALPFYFNAGNYIDCFEFKTGNYSWKDCGSKHLGEVGMETLVRRKSDCKHSSSTLHHLHFWSKNYDFGRNTNVKN